MNRVMKNVLLIQQQPYKQHMMIMITMKAMIAMMMMMMLIMIATLMLMILMIAVKMKNMTAVVSALIQEMGRRILLLSLQLC